MTKVSIHQPEYLSYRGHYFKILSSDIHIFLDDVQVDLSHGPDSGFQYRNRFPDGWHNLEKSKIHQKTLIKDVNLPLNISLADWNIALTVTICRELGYKGVFKRSSDLPIGEIDNPTDRLIKLVKYVTGDTYLMGKGSSNYVDVDSMIEAGITPEAVEFRDTDYYSIFHHICTYGIVATRKAISHLGNLLSL